MSLVRVYANYLLSLLLWEPSSLKTVFYQQFWLIYCFAYFDKIFSNGHASEALTMCCIQSVEIWRKKRTPWSYVDPEQLYTECTRLQKFNILQRTYSVQFWCKLLLLEQLLAFGLRIHIWSTSDSHSFIKCWNEIR